MMRCSDFEKLIALDIEGDLGTRAARRLREHLRGCPSCREFVEGLTASQSMLKDLRGEAVDASTIMEVRRRVMERIGKGGPSWFYALRWKCAYALAAIGLLTGVAVSLRLPVEAPPPLVSPLLHPPAAPVVTARRTPGRPVTAIQARAKPPEPRVLKRDFELPRIELPRIEPARIDPPESPNQLVVKLLTDDPEIVIVWLIDQNGDRHGKAN